MSALKTCPQCGSEYELDIKFCPKDGSTLRVPAGENLVGSVIADRYHVLRKLGEGGMGQVYLAEHVKMGRKSAIKVMNPSMSHDPDAIGRFNREAANASRISHNNVAAIYDFGETPEGLIYLAMEYIEGEPLTKIMERTGALPPARAADIARQVAEALEAAHELGIVHRDLKPDNIMIATAKDGRDVVKVVDFGIAKAQGGEGQKVTKTGLVVGTPEYMSPEQLSGDQLDGRSDVYTLGLVTFHMLTGVLPFPSSTIQESMIMRLTDRPRTLSEMRPEATWPAPLQHVLDRALARRADERYQRASDFATDIVRAVSGSAAGAATAGAPTAVNVAASSATVPQTRVAGGGGGAAPTPAQQPATGAAPARRGRRVLVPVGVGAGLLVVAVAAWVLGSEQRGTQSPADTASTAKVPVVAMHDSTPVRAASAQPAGGTAPTAARTDSSAADGASSPPETRGGSGTTTSAPGTANPVRRTEPPPRDVRRPPAVEPYARQESPAQPARTDSTASPPPAGAADNDNFEGNLTAERARAGVRRAGSLLLQNPPQTERALRILGLAMKHLPTLDDSITALYHVSEGLFQRSEATGNPMAQRRACDILTKLRGARWHTYASAINAMYDQQCK